MHARQSLDLAVTLVDRFAVIRALSGRLSETALQQYWVSARSLLDQWGFALRQCRAQLETRGPNASGHWHESLGLFQEVLITETLTRVWCCVLSQCDCRIGVDEYGPIGRSVFISHLDARRRVLELMVRGRQAAGEAVGELNRMRIAVERWTDLLLSYFPADDQVDRFSFDAVRCRNFRRAQAKLGEPNRVLIGAAIGTIAETVRPIEPDRAELHERLQTAILSCLAPQLFSTSGPMLSSWHARLMSIAEDSDGLLKQWLAEGSGQSEDGANPGVLGRF